MNKGFSFFKDIQLERILITAAVSVLMLFSTACSRATATDAASVKAPSGSSPNPPGQVQPYKGGMNNFDDVDPTRSDKSSVDAKAKALKDQVERNINERGIDSPEQYVKNYRSGTPINERVENIGKDLGKTAADVKESLQEVGERGSKNLERNVKSAPGQASRTFDQAKQNVKAAGDDVSRGVKEPVNKADKVLDRAGEYAQDKADDAVNAAARAVN